jgi:hypothetical protein
MVNKLKTLDTIALILVIIGGLNWGLYSFGPQYNVVEMIFGISVVSNIIYLLVGISAVYLIFVMNKLARK